MHTSPLSTSNQTPPSPCLPLHTLPRCLRATCISTSLHLLCFDTRRRLSPVTNIQGNALLLLKHHYGQSIAPFPFPWRLLLLSCLPFMLLLRFSVAQNQFLAYQHLGSSGSSEGEWSTRLRQFPERSGISPSSDRRHRRCLHLFSSRHLHRLAAGWTSITESCPGFSQNIGNGDAEARQPRCSRSLRPFSHLSMVCLARPVRTKS